MKHRVVVQAIFKEAEKILLLRRSQGKPGLLGKYELPGGALDYGEQPEDSIRRHLKNDAGIDGGYDVYIEDAFSMKSRDDAGLQYTVIIYALDDPKNLQIKLGPSYDKYVFVSIHDIKPSDLRDSAQVALGLHDGSADINFGDSYTSKDVENTTKDYFVVFSDGGSRGNPGPSAAAFVVFDNKNNKLDQGGEYIGITTNNQAEYRGVLLGLEHALKIGVRKVDFRIDSMLVVNQLKGLYKVKNRDLWPMNDRIKSLVTQFDDVKFTHVPRELNKAADALVNKILDENG